MPVHVNQFTAGGRFPDRPDVAPALRGKPSGPYDCTVADGIMALDDFTGGAVRPSVSEFRRRQSDNDKSGIGLNDVAQAWRTWGLTFTHRAATWGQVMARLRAGRPVILQGFSGALGSWDVGRAVPHALYVTRAGPRGLTVHDSRRGGPVVIPERDVRNFYITGLALAGWGEGPSAPTSTGSNDSPALRAGGTAALLSAWGTIVTFPVGHKLTAADVDAIIAKLTAAGLLGTAAVPDPFGMSAGVVRAVLTRHIGEPWSKALQDTLQRELNAAAAEAVALGGVPAAITAGLDAFGATLGSIAGHMGLLVAIVVLALLGVWLTFRESGGVTVNLARLPRG